MREGFTPCIKNSDGIISHKKNLCGGFTLIEMLVVVAVTVTLSAILIIFGHSSRQQVFLYTEESRLVQEILKAKSLSLDTYNSTVPSCGYGVHLNYGGNSYSLFSYIPDPSKGITCDKITNLVPSGAENDVETIQLNENLTFGAASNRLDYVFFLPPNPDTLLAVNGDSSVKKNISGNIPLETKDGSANVTITVNPAGQVTY